MPGAAPARLHITEKITYQWAADINLQYAGGPVDHFQLPCRQQEPWTT
jgi:hypothetical protein